MSKPSRNSDLVPHYDQGTVAAIECVQASICRDSFADFAQEFWGVVCQEPLLWNWHLDVFADEAECLARCALARKPSPYDLLINVPPGSSKSKFFSVLLPAWCLANDPTFQIICGSYSYGLSLDFGTQCRDVVRSEKYQRYFPHVQIRLDQAGKEYWKTTAGGFRFSTSTGGGTVTGFHGHLIIIDDPIDPSRAVSKVELEAANKWMSDTIPSRKVHKDRTPIILIQQRLAENDPSGMWREKARRGKKLRHICLPAELNDEVRPKELAEFYSADGLLDPVRMNRRVLNEALIELGQYTYSAQYGQKPVPPGEGMFLTEVWAGAQLLTPGAVHPAPIQRSVRYWDKAATAAIKNPGSCFTVGVRMRRMTNGQFLVDDVVRGQWSTDRREAIIKATAQLDGPTVEVWVEQEGGSGGQDSARMTIKGLQGYRVYADRPKGDKTLRADPYSVQVNAGHVYLTAANWTSAYIDEFRWFPLGKYKDQVDASSGAFAVLTGRRKSIRAF